MTDIAVQQARVTRLRRWNLAGGLITALTVAGAVFWAFPIYWGMITTFKVEQDVLTPGIHLLPQRWTLDNYIHVLTNTQIGTWYINSIVTALVTTFCVILTSAAAGYAISQLRFPGRRLLWITLMASFMVPVSALIVNHFVLMADLGFVNTWTGTHTWPVSWQRRIASSRRSVPSSSNFLRNRTIPCRSRRRKT